MSLTGTAAYDGEPAESLPPLVRRALDLARTTGFAYSCLPGQGRLLSVLAHGAGPAAIGETGTGCGVGLAWLATAAHPGARLVSIERDPERAAAAAALFAHLPQVEVRCGDWRELARDAPFDLLVADGGGQGKGDDEPLDPAVWLRPGGLLAIDDFSPLRSWPPLFEGRVDEIRMHWLDHPRLRATQVNVAPDHATILASYLGPGAVRPTRG